jgi:hypothetical protein
MHIRVYDGVQGRVPNLPRNTKFLVDFFRREESIDILLQGRLKLWFEDDILPVGLLDFPPERVVLLPETLVENPDFVVKSVCPTTRPDK